MNLRPARLFTLALIALAACHGGAGPNTPTHDRSSALAPNGSDDAPRVGFAIAEAPLSLTASDGSGLRLARLQANTVVDGPLAFTELHLAFDNPADRTIEGTFRIALPQGASLGRFAMRIDDAWQEGEVVELEAARRAYEDFLHRKQDPALMEKAAGNEFSARVFPIPARGTKELVVSWVEEVKDGRFVLPLKGLPELGTLEAAVSVVGAKTQPARLAEKNRTPAADFTVDLRPFQDKSEKMTASAIRNRDLALVRVRPQADAKPDPLGATVVLVDTSASRSLGFDAELDSVGRIVKGVAENKANVTVAAFDQTVTPIFEGAATSFGGPELGKIRSRGALGASDVERALGWARDAAKKAHASRIVLVTDGVATAGATDPKKLVAKVASLREAGVERIDAVAVGGIRDDAGLLRLVRGNLPRDGIVADASRDSFVRRLGQVTRSGIAVKVEGATFSWPAKLDGVQPGDSFSIYAEIPEGKDLKVSIDGAPAEIIAPRATDRPLLSRAIAQAKVSSMLEREIASKESLKKQIVAIATRERIMTPYTAMLVLESERDYQQYGIDRKSLRDVLAIENGAVRQLHRTTFSLPMAASASAAVDHSKEDEETRKSALVTGAAETESTTTRSRPTGGAAPGAATPPRVAASAAPRPRSLPTPAPDRAPEPSKTAEKAEAPMEKKTASAGPPPPAPPPPPPPAGQAHFQPRPPAPGPAPEPPARRPPPDDVRAALAAAAEESMDDGPHHDDKPPYEGRMATVMDLVQTKRLDEALASARAWRAEAPGDVLALVALGEAAEAKGMTELAGRAYGSIVDLFSNRADLRRFAGERLERLGARDPLALELAIDSFEKAATDRPDHPSSHRLLTFALVRRKLFARAFESALAGLRRGYEVDRFAGVERILREDLGLVGAAWAAAEPARREEILKKVREAGGKIEDQPSLRFVLNWETDANDVDFHIHDGKGGHAFYGSRQLKSGGELYADVTTGYGPECFTIRGAPGRRAGPYKLEAHYYSRGPMGYGMGKLEVIEHDGKGGLTFEERPFVVMVDQAFVELGTVR